MVTDPAVEAARRAWDATDGYGFDNACDSMEEAAREALARIREIHQSADPDAPAGMTQCHDCWQTWPCDTAKLIYTSEEL